MIKFLDLKEQYLEIKDDLTEKLNALMLKGDFILGREVKLFEEEFAKFCKTKYAVGVNSGTDALFISLKCLNIGVGDEVIVPAFTFVATSFAVTYVGAKPVFVDIAEDTCNIDVLKIETAITKRTKAIIPVHLFGLCANMPEILEIAKKYNLHVIEDACQAHGAKIGKKKAGSIGDIGCFSFYPTKNLSAFGDAGAITTNNRKLYEKLLQLRDCGRPLNNKRYLHNIIGYNSRLDNIQAAILRLKLKHINKWNERRIDNAKIYSQNLKSTDGIIIPKIPENFKHVFHIYSIRAKKRNKLIGILTKNKIPYTISYPLPLHLQKANLYLGYQRGDFPIAEKVSKEILGLPIHPYLKKANIERIYRIIKNNIFRHRRISLGLK